MKELVGKRLLECRKACKLTQQQVAEYLGVAQPVYHRFEKGVFECNYAQLVALANLFDVSIDYLLGRADV
ncbi:MAG: helix-turn-helix transcriptional regulator [Clostridia bacterium]|nr:helix-turn-helix transcriptional regulator [Clostridia bacterium]